MNGRFIVLEGPDGSGTTLHSKLLVERLTTLGIPAILTAEPTDGSIGKEIRNHLNGNTMPPPDAIQLLFCADRAEHVEKVILPALEKGTTVVTDRYSLSTIMYGSCQGIDSEWLKEINYRFPTPDMTIVALPSFDICQQRLAKRGVQDQFEKKEFQQCVYNMYRGVDDANTVIVDTSGDKQTSADAVWKHVEPLFQSVSREDIVAL